MLTTKLTRRLCMALALAAVPFTASAQQVIKITAMDGYPERALWVKEFIEFYMPEVDKRLAKTGKYKIEWQKAFGGQIVKPRGEFDGLKSGLGDMAIITTVFYEDKLPLNNVPYFTPFSIGQSEDRRQDHRRSRQQVSRLPQAVRPTTIRSC